MANDIIVSEMTSASQINTNDLMIMTQPDLQAETGYSTKKGTVLQVANKMLKGTEYLTDLPDFTDKTVLGGLEELKGDLTALLPVNTASGAIANFDTDLSLPLVDCKANIVASQPSGTPTPSDPLPISGFTSCTVTVADEDLDPQDTYTVSWQTEAGTVYGGNLDLTTGVLTKTHIIEDMGNLVWTTSTAGGYTIYACNGISNKAQTTSATCEIFPVVAKPRDQLSDGEMGFWNLSNTMNRFAVRADNIATLSDFQTAVNGKKIVYEVTTPVTYQLTPVQINALLGVNNVFNDTNGDTEVKYKEGIQHYIDKKIAATQALIL